MENQHNIRGHGRPRILTDRQRIDNKTKYVLGSSGFVMFVETIGNTR